MLSKVARFSLSLLLCFTALSFSTVAFADESDDDEQSESRKPRKKARKTSDDSDSASTDSDDEDASRESRRRRKARRADPDEEEEEEEEAKPKKPAEAPSYSKRSGFMIQTSLITQTSAFNAGTASIQLSGFEGGLSAGYKAGRFMIGLGFDFTNVNSTAPTTIVDPDNGGVRTVTVSTSNYSFVVYPEVQYAFVQSDDQRVELIGNGSLGLGSFGTTISPSNGADDDSSRFRLRWRIGPGVRYWLHPQFAASLIVGVSGNHLITSVSGAASSSSATTALYSQIGLVGVF